MTPRLNLASARGADLTKALRRIAQDASSARSPLIEESAKALRKRIARVLSTPAGARLATSLRSRTLHAIGGTPSRPGEAPRKQTGQLAKSVKQGLVETGRRVGPLAFYGSFLDPEGLRATLGERRWSGRGKKSRTRITKKSLTIAARPFMARALDQAKDEMIGVTVRKGEERTLELVRAI